MILMDISLLSTHLFSSNTHSLHFFNFSSFPRKHILLFPIPRKTSSFLFQNLHKISLFPISKYHLFFICFLLLCVFKVSHRLGQLVSPISPKILTFSFTHFIKHLVCITLNTKFMAPKVNKEENVMGISSTKPVSALSLLHPTCVEQFEKNFRNMIVVKHHVYDPTIAVQLHIPQIVNLMEHKEINNFLKVSTAYKGDLIRLFYVGLESRERFIFLFKMGKNSYQFIEDSQRGVFGIYILSHQATLFDHALDRDFD